MCPAMIDAPVAPGRGLPVNQPAIAALIGTCSVCVLVRLRRMSPVLTPIAGMRSLAGLATLGRPDGPGSLATTPRGTGILTIPAGGWPAAAGAPGPRAQPPRPSAVATAPQASSASPAR